MTLYLAGAGLGAICGAIAYLLSLGVLQRRKLLPRLIKLNRFPTKRLLLSVFIEAAIGCYGVWAYSGLGYDYLSFLALTTCLHSTTLTDIRHRALHLDVMCFFAVLGIGMCLLDGGLPSLLSGFLGAVVGALLLGVPYLLRRDSVGVGDILLLANAGLYCGSTGVLLLLLRALMLLAVVSLVQLMRKKATRKSQMPLAPYLLISSLL